ncbi:MAG: hypothetical protein JKY57_00130 [Kordiimonadaceae bacterium]|nr:hypothetical protein [Kordiimonadaceae bacterium]
MQFIARYGGALATKALILFEHQGYTGTVVWRGDKVKGLINLRKMTLGMHLMSFLNVVIDMLDTDYLSKLPKNAALAAAKICEDFSKGNINDDPMDVLYVLRVLLGEEAKEKDRKLKDSFMPKTRAKEDIRSIQRHVKAVVATEMILGPEKSEKEVADLLAGNYIEFDKQDVSQIGNLLSEIRDVLRSSDELDENHKLRLLKIVNDLQKEIDKPLSSYRVFLDSLIETSEALGTAGKNIKPVFDRVREIFGIVDSKKKKMEQIASPEELRQLPSPESLEKEVEA